jgi:nucleotide-binding universal stress UspA family protein
MAGKVGFRSIVLGLDGSAHSRRAVAFVARLRPPAGGRVACIQVVEPVRAPSMPLVPASVRANLLGEVAALNRRRFVAARRGVEAAMAELTRSGWHARGDVRTGVPLTELLAAVKTARGDLLVLGARGAGGIARFLLGSVSEAALSRAPVSVLIVR